MTFWSGGCAAGSESFSTAGTHNFVVPRGCSAVTVRVWGAGGGGGGVSTGTSNSEAAAGGGGGLAQGTLAVTPNELLTVVVGSGGGAGANHASNGGGGGGGGGYSKIARGGTDLVIGAGGGGGGGTKNSSVPAGLGGAGGGTNGVAGTNSGGTPTGGGGGTTAGGAAGTGSTNGTVGSSLAGGAGGTSTGGGAGGSAGSPGGSAGGTSASSSNAGGGGGGGGYFGGGGGGAGNPAAGGGGGSAYVKPSETFAALSSGNGSYPGGENLIDYGAGAGIGGVGATSTPATTATAGAEGRVVIFWHRESFDFAVGTSTFVVPDGCSSMRIKAWGGGGGGSGAKTNNSDGNVGGGGGFTDGFVAVTPGETLSVIVGGGGNPGENQSGGGGGGGGGGGRTEIVRSGTPLLIAGGGGGAGGGANAVGGAGGAGGGASGAAGGDGQANGGGDGGTDSAGGAAGSGGNSPVATAGSASSGGTGGRGGTNTAGGAGGYNQGGAGEGGNGGSNGGGGGGGGGYYGGGGGGGTSPGSGGGGGSSFGTGTLSQASGSTAAGSGDADYRSATGTGGTAGTATLLATAGRGGILLASCGGTATGSPTIAANPGYAEGDVRISVDLPNDALDSFDHIVIRRLAGSTPPAAACDGAGGEIVHTFNAALADPSAYVDSPGSPGSFFSYRACVYDSANNLVAAPAKSGVRSEKYHMLIFTSSTLHNGNLGGLSGADAKCQAAADAAAIDVEFQALVSTAAVDLRFRTNFPLGLPIYRTDGVTVVADLPELWNAEAVDLLAAVSKDEYQATPTSDIWTGSKRDAFKATETCTSWTSSASGVNGKRGDATKTQQNFLEDGNDKCDKTKHLYCLSADVVTYGTKKTLSGPYQVPTGFHFYRVNAADQAPTTYNATFDADEGANLGQSCLWKVLFADTNDGETDYDVIDGSGNLITRIFFPMCAGGTCHAIVNRCGSGAYDAAAKTAYVVERGTTSTAGAPTDSFTNSCTTSAAPLAVDGWDNDCDGTMDELTYVSCTYSDLVTKTVGAAYTAPATQTCNGNTANFGSCTWTVPNGRNCYYANTICSGAPTTTVDEWNSSSAQSGTVPNDLTHTITGTACFTTAGVCQSQKNIVSRTAFTTVDCTYKYATYP